MKSGGMQGRVAEDVGSLEILVRRRRQLRHDVETAELGRSGRHRRVVLARAMITLLCRELTTMSYPEIARALGKKNHSTVITAHQRIDRQMGEPVRLGLAVDGLTIEQLRDRLRGDLTGGRQD